MARLPPNAGKGRPKGSKNRLNLAFRDALIDAFREIGGTPALVVWGRQTKNRALFYQLCARLIPTEAIVSGDDTGGPVRVVHHYHDGPPVKPVG